MCYNHRACFNDLVLFVQSHVQPIRTDPLLGDIRDVARGSPGPSWTNPRSRISKVTGSSFATAVTQGPCLAQGFNREKKTTKNKGCMCLLFRLADCPRLQGIKHWDKIDFLKGNREKCFGCLCSGHRGKECSRGLTCKDCDDPTALHIVVVMHILR